MPEENEMVETLRDVVTRFDRLGIEYMITGSFAMSPYVTARTTLDLDVIVLIKSTDADRIEKSFAGDYYVSAASIRRAYERQSMFNIVNNQTLVKVDCIIRKDDRFEREKFERRRRAILGGVEAWVISKEDLIISKLWWARESHSELQFRDIRNLLETEVDEAVIHRAVVEQGLGEAWNAFSEWKTRVEK